ncbi:hypothetical protein DFA_01689 [Cavenderia fasciculata]|uniref:Uncharacterized protein n=1 Tax=Cavenderia fasciculata TaxID=261658 RepID=F4PU88_CACFS|nr:uncharacterized protein DFA_01689 [Cavenderia fasciculata]EGG21803.1 hypothetical protein DFA_01689 [Cavenderia fasciculata]|eukprot:XP_004359653.1 hypothetical protein DFA_01689 [Cavenderia fasciculata]
MNRIFNNATTRCLVQQQISNHSRYSYSTLNPTTGDLKIKTRIPIFKPTDDSVEHIAIGKLKEDEHSVALYSLEFISLDNIVNLNAEQLSRLVVIPKEGKLTLEQRIEKLESDLKRITQQTSDPSKSATNNKTKI